MDGEGVRLCHGPLFSIEQCCFGKTNKITTLKQITTGFRVTLPVPQGGTPHTRVERFRRTKTRLFFVLYLIPWSNFSGVWSSGKRATWRFCTIAIFAQAPISIPTMDDIAINCQGTRSDSWLNGQLTHITVKTMDFQVFTLQEMFCL